MTNIIQTRVQISILGSDIYLKKIKNDGTDLWFKLKDYGHSEWGEFVTEICNGFAIVGCQLGPDQGQLLLVITDALGNDTIIWSYGPTSQFDCGYCVQQFYDYESGRYGLIITGRVYNSQNSSPDIWLIKTLEDGTLIWEKKFGGPDWDEGRYVINAQPDRGYLICGTYAFDHMYLIKTDASGNFQWSKLLRPPQYSGAHGYAVKQTSDGGYIAVGKAMGTIGYQDIYVVKLNRTGDVEWQKIIDHGIGHNDYGYGVDIIKENEYIIAGTTFSPGPPWADVYLVKLGHMLNDTNDPLSLAYNGNRHLVREPNTEKLHLVYTRMDSVIYQYSSDGGTSWTTPLAIGKGKFPAITLSSDNLPSVTWTDEIGGLWYRRQIAPGQWGEIYHPSNPVGPYDPFLNSPPSIAVVPGNPDEVHILITRTGRVQMNGVAHTVDDYSFPITNPENGEYHPIDVGTGGMYPPIRLSPSIARSSLDNSLHAVWLRQDTVCYATKNIGQPWQNWGDVFDPEGHQSAHPFVECYGDMVYVVWEHKQTPSAPEDVWKGQRRLSDPNFPYWDNLSRTPNTPSRYPVNASGLFTVFQDSPYPPINGPEIYYKVHPEDDPFNISQTTVSSLFPQSVARITGSLFYLYTAWQDGAASPYEIRFKKLSYIPPELPAYLTSVNGNEVPSSYLVQRDTFYSDWQIPVDIGSQKITYRFPLEPGYRYKIKVVAYHQLSGQWREWVKIDNGPKHQIKYNPFKPETLEFWVPTAFYQDGTIDVVFDRISGSFATAGPIYIYRYEYEEGEGGGPMAQESHTLNNPGLAIFPNPFRDKLNIRYTISDVGQGFSLAIKIYDVTGRLIKQYNNPSERIIWNGRDEYGRKVAPGVYFLRIENTGSNQSYCQKILKLE
ncbi:MAG: T9SS type A sorting domain-containing protein [candidate division WOR-3 bacterium]